MNNMTVLDDNLFWAIPSNAQIYVSGNPLSCYPLSLTVRPAFMYYTACTRQVGIFVTCVCMMSYKGIPQAISAWESMGFEPKTCRITNKGNTHLASMTCFVRAQMPGVREATEAHVSQNKILRDSFSQTISSFGCIYDRIMTTCPCVWAGLLLYWIECILWFVL